jgi:hypothetical protein
MVACKPFDRLGYQPSHQLIGEPLMSEFVKQMAEAIRTAFPDVPVYDMGSPMTLAEWLLAQIDADEKVAWVAGSITLDEPWGIDGEQVTGGARGWMTIAITLCRGTDTSIAEHIATHDPARVLAECAAKRALIELHQREWGADVDHQCTTHPFSMVVCQMVRILAQPYADREGWQAEWAVTP